MKSFLEVLKYIGKSILFFIFEYNWILICIFLLVGASYLHIGAHSTKCKPEVSNETKVVQIEKSPEAVEVEKLKKEQEETNGWLALLAVLMFL